MKKQSSCNGMEKNISNAGKTKLIAEVKTKTNIPRSLKARTKHCICFTKGQNGEKKTFGATSEANFAVNRTIIFPLLTVWLGSCSVV